MPTIIIERDGKRTVVTGWRAWLAAALMALTVAVPLALIAFLVLGIAVTLGAVLIIMIPGILAAALLMAALAKWRWRSGARR